MNGRIEIEAVVHAAFCIFLPGRKELDDGFGETVFWLLGKFCGEMDS